MGNSVAVLWILLVCGAHKRQFFSWLADQKLCSQLLRFECLVRFATCRSFSNSEQLSNFIISYLRNTFYAVNFCNVFYWLPLLLNTPLTYSGAEKFLARPGRKQSNISVRMAWISFGALPCGKRNLMTARVSNLLKSRASLTCFRDCFLPGRAKDFSSPRYVAYNERSQRLLFHIMHKSKSESVHMSCIFYWCHSSYAF